MQVAELWKWQGRVTRADYIQTGFAAIVVKLLLDYIVVTQLFHRGWTPLFYWRPFAMVSNIRQLTGTDAIFAACMLVLALPFVWIGVSMTARRLRDADLAVWLACLFFVPAINLALFAVLCVLPTKNRDKPLAPQSDDLTFLTTLAPQSGPAGVLYSVVVAAMIGLGFTTLGTGVLQNYGWGLFVGLPFCTGLVAVLLYSLPQVRELKECLIVSILPLILLALMILATALDGLICILMAAPIAVALGAMGGYLGYVIQSARWGRRNSTAMLSVALLLTPSAYGLEHVLPPQTTTFLVTSSIDVNAPPEKVWEQVIAFSEIPPPNEMIFRAGVAYPIRAEIHGSGSGAVRYCMFSTGQFVEPIEVWQEPTLLRFRVTANPAPMNELSPYPHIEPPHLHGYFESHQGQFQLTKLPDGRTRLEGTTWYSHALWPQVYWHHWSDYIIHTIHMRVLKHIKTQAELPS
jgi:uncharacterized membrane protein YhaH (DUF805 family)